MCGAGTLLARSSHAPQHQWVGERRLCLKARARRRPPCRCFVAPFGKCSPRARRRAHASPWAAVSAAPLPAGGNRPPRIGPAGPRPRERDPVPLGLPGQALRRDYGTLAVQPCTPQLCLPLCCWLAAVRTGLCRLAASRFAFCTKNQSLQSKLL